MSKGDGLSLITASIMPFSKKEAISLLDKTLSMEDLAELRIDLIPDLDILEIGNLFDKKRMIITNRKKDEGGLFEGNESDRLHPLINAMKLGFGFIDIEHSSIDSLKLLISKKRTLKSETKIILSYHNFQNTPVDMKEIVLQMKDQDVDIIKVVTHANDISDNLIIKDILFLFNDNPRLISFLMGERGEISRVLCNSWGSFTTYAPLKGLDMTAPGQIPLEVLRDIYRVNSIDETFDIYGLIGNPVKESIGYYVHNKLFSYYKMDAVYLNLLVDDLGKFMKVFEDYFKGFCVTMPFKETIIPYLENIDQMALKIGAVNTIKKNKNGLLGTNTDLLGAVYSIEKISTIKDKKVLILGAGGAGKAIAFGVASKLGKVIISNRDHTKAIELAKKLGAETIPWENRDRVDFDILVNATKIGMSPEEDGCPMEDSFFERDLSGITVFDAVYSPIDTRLLTLSKKQGAKIASGLDMYIGQAMAQFEFWTGITPSYKEMERFSKEAILLRGDKTEN